MCGKKPCNTSHGQTTGRFLCHKWLCRSSCPGLLTNSCVYKSSVQEFSCSRAQKIQSSVCCNEQSGQQQPGLISLLIWFVTDTKSWPPVHSLLCNNGRTPTNHTRCELTLSVLLGSILLRHHCFNNFFKAL